ncbi:MAG: hypothetical protein V4581_03265 [Bacteroidota bacterium]
MNKSGQIILLEPDSETCSFLCGTLTAIANKNEVICFSNTDDASAHLAHNVSNVFLVLQNFSAPGLHLPHCRNMVFIHEKFNIESIAHMFLVQSKEETPADGLHTFIHCYYRDTDTAALPKTFTAVIDFWNDHVFTPHLARNRFGNMR